MASNSMTKDIESRLKQQPSHIFEVFLEIHEPIGNDPAAILITYPENYSDEILKTAANFAYPCRVRSNEQNENFTFVVLDSSASIFRFGFCRRSNRESTCLCLISYYPWFEMFYTILNDISQIINSRTFSDVETFLSSIFNYPLLSLEEFYKNEGHETIEINLFSQRFRYNRPDLRKLPSVLSNQNFSVTFSLLGPDLILRLFGHVLFERRILFVSSKLFHLSACSCACLNLVYPFHWQSIFLPILPENLSWTCQCTAPFIIGVHTSIFEKLNRRELDDVTIVKIDERKIESPYDDLQIFPKDLVRSMKKGIEQSYELVGDQLARVFLRSMAFIVGDYGNGFVIKNDRFDFDRQVYLEQYRQSTLFSFMLLVVNTQMFEQFSRYRVQQQFEREIDVDEFEIEVKNLQRQQLKKQTNSDLFSKLKSTRNIGKILEKAANPLVEQVQDTAEQIQSAMNKFTIRNNVESSPSTIVRPAQNAVNFDPKKNSNEIFQLTREKSDSSDEKILSLIDVGSDQNSSRLSSTQIDENSFIQQFDPFSVGARPNSTTNFHSTQSKKNFDSSSKIKDKTDLIQFDE